MTEFETAYLFYEVYDGASTSLMNFITIMFAMLVASYLVAPRLSRTMAALVVILYSLISFGMINDLTAIYGDFARLGDRLYDLAQEDGTNLGWHGAASAARSGSLHVARTFIISLAVLGYAGTVVFFFLVRRKKL